MAAGRVRRRLAHGLAATAALLAAGLLAATGPARADDDPRQFVKFEQEFSGTCVARNGVEILVRNTHPSRKLRVWLDRYHMGVGTGDRSRSDLAPGGEAEPLGCSRTTTGEQEWRVVKAQFVD